MGILKLIQKDFRAHRVYLLYSVVLLCAISTLFTYLVLLENGRTDFELIMYFVIVLASTSIVSLLFIQMDELYKTDEIFASLPVTRTQIIIAKYLSSFIQVLLALAVHFLGIQLGAYFHGSPGSPQLEIIYNPLLWLIMGVLLLFFKSYSYPLYFRFGLTIGAATHGVIQFLWLVILILSFRFFNLQLKIEQLIEWGSGQNGYLLLTALVMAVVALMILSMTLSSKFFKHKAI
tara:strand:- start:7281 stop:7979 length:699 start_codon:yes stop_codon:yes gene_type:complete